MAFQLSRGLIGQQAGLPAQSQPGLGQSNVAPNAYSSQQYNTAYATGQGPMGALPGSAPGVSAGVAPFNNMQPQQVGSTVPYNTALKPEGDGNGFGTDSLQGQGPQQKLAPKPKAAAKLSGLGQPSASGNSRQSSGSFDTKA